MPDYGIQNSNEKSKNHQNEKLENQQDKQLNSDEIIELIDKITAILCSDKEEHNDKSDFVLSPSDFNAQYIAKKIYKVTRYKLKKDGNCYNIEECIRDIIQSLCRKLQTKKTGEIIRNLEFYCTTSASNCTSDYLKKKCHICRKAQVSLEDEEFKTISRPELRILPQTIQIDELINDLQKFSQTLNEEDSDWLASFKAEGANDKELHSKLKIKTPDLNDEAFKQRKSRKKRELAFRFKLFCCNGTIISKGNS